MDEPRDDHDTSSAEPVAAPHPAESDAPHVPQHASTESLPEAHRPSRRWFVAGAVALVVGGGAGVAFDFARGRPTRPARRALPAALRAALADERTLLAGVRAARGGHDVSPGVLDALAHDHQAHLRALTAAAAGYAKPARDARPSAPSGASDRADLRRLEQQASHRAARRALQLSGNPAALLASIAACEATHAELLT